MRYIPSFRKSSPFYFKNSMDEEGNANLIENVTFAGGQDSLINLNLESVYGPFKILDQIPESNFNFMVNKTYELFIPIKLITDSYENIKAHTLIGNNLYSVLSSLIAIIYHQGIIVANVTEITTNHQEPKYSVSFSGNRVVNVFDQEYNVTQSDKFAVEQKQDEQFVGVCLIVQITPEIQKFDSVKNFEVKSRAGKGGLGIELIYGEPTFIEPQCLEQSALYCAAFFDEPQYDELDLNWLKFGFSGEVMTNYDQRSFIDYDLPYEQWLTQKFKKASLYFDTFDQRYELTATQGGKLFKLSLLLDNAPSLGQIRSEGSPLKEDRKMLIADSIDWATIIWDTDSININDVKYGPIHSYYWAKRKRIIV